MAAADKSYQVITVDDVDVVRLIQSKMSPDTIEGLQNELARKIAAGTRKMVLNLAPVKFLDSFGIGVVAAAARHMNQAGGQLKLCGIGDRVMMSLTITRLDRNLDIATDETEALRSFRGEG